MSLPERRVLVEGRYLRSGDVTVDPEGFRFRWDRLPGRWRLTLRGGPPGRYDVGAVTVLGDAEPDPDPAVLARYRRAA